MALGTATASQAGGRSASRPSTIDRLSFLGDDSTPAGGTLAFEAYVQAALGRSVEVLAAHGYGKTGANITHFAIYLAGTDALQVFPIAGGAEATGDLSAVTFELDIWSQ